jgi:hypothetical protein
MKLTTQRNLLAFVLLASVSGVAGTCVAQTPQGCDHDISVTASESLIEAIAKVCAKACPDPAKCPDCKLTCCEEGPPAPVPCEPDPGPVELPLEAPEPADKLVELTLVPQLQGVQMAFGWKKWDAPVYLKVGAGTFRLLDVAEVQQASNPGSWDPPWKESGWACRPSPSLVPTTTRETVYTVGAVWLFK